MKNQYKVFHEPTAGRDIYEGKFNTFEEAVAEAMKHFKWAMYWNKALYITETATGKVTYIVKGTR